MKNHLGYGRSGVEAEYATATAADGLLWRCSRLNSTLGEVRPGNSGFDAASKSMDWMSAAYSGIKETH